MREIVCRNRIICRKTNWNRNSPKDGIVWLLIVCRPSYDPSHSWSDRRYDFWQ